MGGRTDSALPACGMAVGNSAGRDAQLPDHASRRDTSTVAVQGVCTATVYRVAVTELLFSAARLFPEPRLSQSERKMAALFAARTSGSILDNETVKNFRPLS